MKIVNIVFKNPTFFLGRNGTFTATAIQMFKTSNGHLWINPVTSKGKAARCEIVIDKDAIKEFVDGVNEIYQKEREGQNG